MIVIADTSPVNYLILIDEIHLLHELYGRVILPAAVFEEMQRPATPEKVRAWAANRPEWVEVRAPSTPSLTLNLGDGEREVITLAEELRADLLLIDDKKARQVAGERNLVVIGTLAVLATAARRNLVDLPKAIERLMGTSFRASSAVIKSLLDQ
jgi:predicted nucleic acid-binding protein